MQPQRAHLITPGDACSEELKRALQQVTGSRNIHISEGAFVNKSMLVLTNYPQKPFPADNPMAGVVGSEKIVVLLKARGGCRLALLDDTGKVLKQSATLNQCQCEAETKE